MEFELKIGEVKKIVDETCDLVKKTNNKFPIDEDEMKEILLESDELESDEPTAYNIFIDIFDEIEEENFDLYSEDSKKVLKKFNSFVNDIDDEDFESLPDLVSIDMKEEKKEEKKEPKSKKKGKKTESKGEVEITFEEAVDFFNHIKDLQDSQDIMISDDLVAEAPTESSIIDTIKAIMEDLDDDDLDELNDSSLEFVSNYKNQEIVIEEKKGRVKKDKADKPKKDKADKPKKDKADKPKKDKVDKADKPKKDKIDKPNKNIEEDAEEDDKKDIEEVKKEDASPIEKSCCGGDCSGEKTLILKGNASIIDALTKMLEVIGK